MFSKILVFILAFRSFGALADARSQDLLQKQHDQLRRLRDEIHEYENKISESKKKESSVLNYLANLNLEIDLTQNLIQKLRKEEKRKTRQIAKLERNLQSTKKELEKLKSQFAKRLVYFYKYGRVKDLELLLTSRSINQGLLWLEYQKRVAENDHRNFVKIQEKQARLIRDKDLRSVELAEKRKIIKSKTREEKNLKSNKAKRQRILRRIRRNTDLLRQQLAEKEKARDEIRKIILRLESTAEQAPLLKPDKPFAELKGELIWPTRGKVIAKFGKYVHPELKTVTENIGIDIQASLGNSVYSVASGRVTAITWQRGRGNIVIVSHYGGFYTVYTHLQEIRVDLMEEVGMGQVIGTVGESGSLTGPMLHFEIWHGTNKLDPEQWLRRNMRLTS
ncbi:MAG: murein hydrolase activator EnvC family protein [bacterium]